MNMFDNEFINTVRTTIKTKLAAGEKVTRSSLVEELFPGSNKERITTLAGGISCMFELGCLSEFAIQRQTGIIPVEKLKDKPSKSLEAQKKELEKAQAKLEKLQAAVATAEKSATITSADASVAAE